MDIELRLLRSFVEIFERGSISRAAVALACTQAAMSMRLKMLEAEIGEPLFLRRHNRLEPTSRGSELYARAVGVLDAYDEMVALVRNRAPRQKVRIGIPDDYALALLTPTLRQLTPVLAEAEIEIICGLSANLMASLHSDAIDIALATLDAKPSSASMAIETDLNWVHHPGFRIDGDRPIPLSAYPEGCVFRRSMIDSMEHAQRPWRVMVQSRSHAGILSAVHAGAAVTAMGKGMAPSGLVETVESEWLPKLRRAPIYLVCLGANANPAIKQIKEAILENMKLAWSS